MQLSGEDFFKNRSKLHSLGHFHLHFFLRKPPSHPAKPQKHSNPSKLHEYHIQKDRKKNDPFHPKTPKPCRLSLNMAVSQNLRYLFGVGYQPTIVFFKGFLGVHRGTGVLTHCHMFFAREEEQSDEDSTSLLYRARAFSLSAVSWTWMRTVSLGSSHLLAVVAPKNQWKKHMFAYLCSPNRGVVEVDGGSLPESQVHSMAGLATWATTPALDTVGPGWGWSVWGFTEVEMFWM